MIKKLTILFLGGAKRVSMAEELIRAGKELGIEVSIFSHELCAEEPISCIGKVIVGGKYSIPATVIELNEIIKSYQVDIVVPFIDPAISMIEDIRLKYPNIYSPTSKGEIVKALFDKVESAKVFKDNELLIPETYTNENVKFPAIFKPRFGSASKGIFVVRSQEEFDKIINKDEYLIQEYIEHREEYTLDCFIGMLDNEIKCVVPRIRLQTAGGEVIRTQTCRIPHLIKEGERVIKALNLQGAVTLQFLYDRDNERFLLMEINPRLGGGVICSIKAGADIAKMIINEGVGEKAPSAKIWRDGTLMTRYMKEVIFYKDGFK